MTSSWHHHWFWAVGEGYHIHFSSLLFFLSYFAWNTIAGDVASIVFHSSILAFWHWFKLLPCMEAKQCVVIRFDVSMTSKALTVPHFDNIMSRNGRSYFTLTWVGVSPAHSNKETEIIMPKIWAMTIPKNITIKPLHKKIYNIGPLSTQRKAVCSF